jgi:hypothetical protein
VKTAWFLLYFWATLGNVQEPGVVNKWFGDSKASPAHGAAVQQARRPYESKQDCLDDIPRVIKTFDAATAPGEVGFVCVEGVVR